MYNEIFKKLFDLIENLIWMHNVDSTCNVQERLKELKEIKKLVKDDCT